MKKRMLLLKAVCKRQLGSLLGVTLLLLLVALSAYSSLALLVSGEGVVSAEMDRLGFGDLTVWVNGHEAELQTELQAHRDVAQVTVQPLLFVGYQANGQYSDNEGQLLVYDGTVPYHIINEAGEIVSGDFVNAGQVYISPAMRSSFGVAVGDVIQFELARSNGLYSLTVAGYFEDAFMGSSMIDMKSFLISAADHDAMLEVMAASPDYDMLAHHGAMLHITQRANSTLSTAAFSRTLFTDTNFSADTAFTYSKASILSYMLLLQNILTGFMLAFSAVLFVICMIVLSHSLSAVIHQGRRDLAIMKTLGLPSSTIRGVYFLLYGGCAVCALLAGIVPSSALAQMLSRGMLTSTGMLVTIQFPVGMALLILAIVMALLLLLIKQRTAGIVNIAPMQTLLAGQNGHAIQVPLHKRFLPLFMALREVLSAKGRYIGALLIAMVLVVFLSIVGRMGIWLGPNGEGLMNAFSVAEHDIGVQPFNDRVHMNEIEEVIERYSPIREKYALAMESVTVSGQAYTANTLDTPSWFHVLEGSVCDANSILITHTVAAELGLTIGDSVQVASGGRRANYTVSGIYQCANGMGTNIGMTREGYARIADVNRFIWCYHYVLEDGAQRDAIMADLQDSVRGIDVHTNSWSGLSGIVSVMHLLLGLIYAASALFILVAVCLTAPKLLQAETGSMAIYKSIGFPSEKLRLAFALRFLVSVAMGAMAGMLLASAFADGFIERVFRLFGIGAFSSTFSFLSAAFPPLVVTALFFCFAWLFSRSIGSVSLVKLINENNE